MLVLSLILRKLLNYSNSFGRISELNNIDLRKCLDNLNKSNDDPNDNPLTTMGINSQYYEIDSFNKLRDTLTGKNNEQLIALHINIQSLSAKYDQLINLINELKTNHISLDFILICETFLNKYNKELFQIPGYKLVSRNRINMTRGGVGIYIKDTIQFKRRSDLDIFVEGEFESVFIETTSTTRKTVVGTIYRPPNTNIGTSIERYESIFAKLASIDAVIGTDQNFDFLKLETLNYVANLLNIALSNNMIPTITKPTRLTSHTSTLIDNMYIKCNKPHSIINSSILVTDISDHFPIISSISYTAINKPTTPVKIEYRKLSPEVIDKINKSLNGRNWNLLLELSPNNAYNEFSNI